MKYSLVGLALLILVLAAFLRTSKSEEENLPKIELSEILDRRIQLVGLLGRPVGEVLRIRGHWKDSDAVKGSGKEFVVESVGGAELKSTVVFESFFVHGSDKHGRDLPREIGETWEMIAYEGIRASNQEGLNQALGRPLNQNPFEGIRSFISSVVVTVSRSK